MYPEGIQARLELIKLHDEDSSSTVAVAVTVTVGLGMGVRRWAAEVPMNQPEERQYTEELRRQLDTTAFFWLRNFIQIDLQNLHTHSHDHHVKFQPQHIFPDRTQYFDVADIRHACPRLL